MNEQMELMQEQFLNAVVESDLEKINHFLAQNLDINQFDRRNVTPFLLAVVGGNIEVVKLFLNHGAKVDLQDKEGCTSLYRAASYGRIEIVKILLNRLIEVEQLTDSDFVALPWTSFSDNEVIKVLLNYAIKVDLFNKHGFMPLHWVAAVGQVETFKFLLDQGSKIDQFDKPGQTPLFWAIRGNNIGIIKFLLSEGATIESSDKEGLTLLHVCVIGANKQFNNDIIKILLEHGVKIDQPDIRGMTPLHWAAISGHYEIVQSLLTSGAKVDLLDNYGSTPLHFAAERNYVEIVKILLQYGAKIDQSNKQSCAPLQKAVVHGHVETVRCLLERGANPQFKAIIRPLIFEKRHSITEEYLQHFKKPLPKEFVFSQDFSVMLRVWYPKKDKQTVSMFTALWFSRSANVGHVSISIRRGKEETYISHWPEEQAGFLKSVPSRNNSLLRDLWDEGEDANPDVHVVLYSLDVVKMVNRYKEIGTKARWFIGGSSKKFNDPKEISHSCASYIHEILMVGGLFSHLLPETDQLRSPMTPSQVADLAKKAKKVEQILYPETKPFFDQEIQTFKAQLLEKSAEGLDQFNALLNQNPDYEGFLYKRESHESMATLIKTIEVNLKKSGNLQLLDLAKSRVEASIMKNIVLPQIDKLLTVGATLEACDAQGYNALHGAVANGNVEIVKRLLAKFPDSKPLASTALEIAIEKGYDDIQELLKDYQHDFEQVTENKIDGKAEEESSIMSDTKMSHR